MFFHRKGWLRKEYDQRLITQMEKLKTNWMIQKSLLEKSVEPSDLVIIQTKIAEAKYFYLFKEAKHRKVKINR
ncbi:DUF2508 domain-containing protein [Bacillus sp. M6-12]|uniref:YaaL family protein n=1 Tax=Bacillus sp. M6-12 TaxID=2054166 RepID=UPI000C77F1BD|nr:YaaL family protein [Bacillus sp. M6-12]PLS14630.1 DUF2508 domain-containing protein [Bacillus sp. M6-12]